MSWSHLAVYLIPPPTLVVALSQAHQILAAEFNTRIANTFMVHCTVKGCSERAEGVTTLELAQRLDALFQAHKAFEVEILPPWFSVGGPFGASCLLLLRPVRHAADAHLPDA